MSEAIDPQREYTLAEAAELLGVSADAAGNWLRAGTLAGEKRAGRWWVSGAELLQARRVNRLALDPKARTATPATGPPERRPLKYPRGTLIDRRRRR